MAAAALALVSCGGGDSDSGAGPSEEVRALLRTVPSDALAVAVRRSCAEAVSLLDSSAALRSLGYGGLEDSPAVISWTFDGKLSPVLAVDAGRTQARAEAARAAAELAGSLGLHAEWYAADSLVGRHAMLVLTGSEALMTAVRRHISEGRSIMDADGFGTAVSYAGQSKDFTVLRNSGARRLLPPEFLEGLYTQRSAAAFLGRISDWITICPESDGRYRLDATLGDTPSYYTNMFGALPFADSRLGEILPSDCSFAVSLPVPQPEFREAYRRYVDASVRYTAYARRLDELEKQSGVNPLDWELENGICEAGIIAGSFGRVVALRHGEAPEGTGAQENPYRGFAGALYGSAFSLPDDSMCAEAGDWWIYGSAEAVNGFTEALAQPSGIKWPLRGNHIVMYKSGRLLCWNKKGIYLWNSDL